MKQNAHSDAMYVDVTIAHTTQSEFHYTLHCLLLELISVCNAKLPYNTPTYYTQSLHR